MTISVGNDSFTYEVAEGWGELPEGYEWGQIGAVNVDAQDRVHIFTRTDHPLMIFDRDGHFEQSTGEGFIKDAHGLCLDHDGNRFLVDRAAQVAMKFTPDGEKIFELGNRDQPSDTGYTDQNPTVLQAAGPFHHPTDVAISASGDFYVSDGYRNARVHKFSADGTLLFSWGEPGTGPGQFRVVHSVWEARGRVYVADRENNRIQVFTPQGEFLEMWTDFLQPCDIYVDDKEATLNEAGDLINAINLGIITEKDIKADIKTLIKNNTTIRNNKDKVTIYKSVGHALSDLAAARLAYKSLI